MSVRHIRLPPSTIYLYSVAIIKNALKYLQVFKVVQGENWDTPWKHWYKKGGKNTNCNILLKQQAVYWSF